MNASFKKSLFVASILSAITFSAQAVNLPYNSTELADPNSGNKPAAAYKVDAHIQALNGAIESNTGLIADNAQKLEQHKQETNNRFENMSGLVQDVNLKATVAEMKADSNTNKINQNKQDIADNAHKINQNKQDIADNAQKLEQHKQETNNRFENMSGLVQDVNLKATVAEMKADSNTNKINQNKQDIADNAHKINQNKQAIAANTETIKQHYAEMKNNFAAVNSRIDNLDEEMKKGAALNGLFQPYNVGKFNLSVAIGGYESEQAMALGTGYRFNENFAMKAGIASDLGGFDSVTYNIGANFEW